MKIVCKIIVLNILVFLTACVGDLDFDQLEDFEYTPAVSVSLLNFELNGEEGSTGLGVFDEVTLQDEVLLPDTNNTLVQEDLDSIFLEFQVTNSFDSSFTIVFTFLDDNDNETYVLEPITVPANQEEVMKYEEEIIVLNNPLFLQSTKARVYVTLNDTSINTSEEDVLNFKSAGTFYFSIN